MLIHPTVERLRALGLSAMADAFIELQNTPDAAELTREDWLGLLVDREATSRENKRLARRLREAKLRQAAVVEDVDYRSAPRPRPRPVPEARHLRVGPRASPSWRSSARPASASRGLACALGHKACRDGFSVLYKRAPRLFADLAQARGEGRLPRLMTTLERTRLLIIDDWGPEPLNAEQRRDLLEIVDDRYDTRLAADHQPGPGQSHGTTSLAIPPSADAILDRIIHRAHRIELKGPSLRRRLVASRKPRCMTARALIAHGGPQRLPTRAAPSLVRALRVARGSPPWTPWTILCRLDRPHHAHATYAFVSAARIAATITPGSNRPRDRRDHDHRNR